MRLSQSLNARRPSGGFTLVELLVVIGIIALLVSILLPTLSKARASAIRTNCASNMRQIGTGAHLFANDNDFRLPYAQAWMESWFPSYIQLADYHQLNTDYELPHEIFNCPAVEVRAGVADYGVTFNFDNQYDREWELADQRVTGTGPYAGQALPKEARLTMQPSSTAAWRDNRSFEGDSSAGNGWKGGYINGTAYADMGSYYYLGGFPKGAPINDYPKYSVSKLIDKTAVELGDDDTPVLLVDRTSFQYDGTTAKTTSNGHSDEDWTVDPTTVTSGTLNNGHPYREVEGFDGDRPSANVLRLDTSVIYRPVNPRSWRTNGPDDDYVMFFY